MTFRIIRKWRMRSEEGLNAECIYETLHLWVKVDQAGRPLSP